MFSIDAALFTQLSLQRGLAFPQIHMTTLQTQTESFCLTPLENTLGASKRKEGEKTDGSLEEVKERLCTLYGNTETSKPTLLILLFMFQKKQSEMDSRRLYITLQIQTSVKR